MQVALLDPFGMVLASGELTVHDAPGIDEHTPSVAEELRERFYDVSCALQLPGMNPAAPYQIRIKAD